MNARIEILDSFLKYARKLALTPDPQKRIEVSKIEIHFQKEIDKARKHAGLVNVVEEEEESERVAED